MVTYCSAQAQVTAPREKATGWLDIGAKVDPDNRVVKELRKRLKLPRLPEKALAENERGRGNTGGGFEARDLKEKATFVSGNLVLTCLHSAALPQIRFCMASFAGKRFCAGTQPLSVANGYRS